MRDGQSDATVPGQTAKFNSVKVLDVMALVGATPAAATLSLGDGTTADKYGTIVVASGGTTGDSADITLTLENDMFEAIDTEKLVVTATSVAAGALVDLVVVIGYY
jgi:hypothetical protein